MAPSWMRSMTSWRALEWRHMKPQPTFSPFFSESSAAARRRRFAGASTANDFSMKTFTPFETACSKCSGRKAAWVVRRTMSPGPRQSIAFL